MGYMVVFMLLVFFVAGVALLVEGVRMCVRRWMARGRMLTLMGTIMEVKREYRRPHSPGRTGRSRGSNYVNFPVIKFRTPYGQDVQFRSETGDHGIPSRYRVGQQVEVLYDPDGEISPLLNDWFGVWFGPVSMTFASIMFIGCSIVCSFLFRDQILQTTVLGWLYELIVSDE